MNEEFSSDKDSLAKYALMIKALMARLGETSIGFTTEELLAVRNLKLQVAANPEFTIVGLAMEPLRKSSE